METNLFLVVADTNGAHETECVYSIWDSHEKATQEIQRLEKEDIDAGLYGGEFHITQASLNTSSDNYFE